MTPLRIGVLTPSSNTVLEPITSAMLQDIPGATAHFSRFTVTRIAPTSQSQAQFATDNLLAAARLLADAKVDVIVWSGTAASWLGFENDVVLCKAIKDATGIPAGSAVLGVNAIFERFNVKRFGLVTPYVASIAQQIQENYNAAGYKCVAERHMNEQDNYSFALFDEACVKELMLECAQAKPDAITVMCTNMRGANLAASIEAQTGVLIVDSTAAAVWDAFRVAGADYSQFQGWGRMFGKPASAEPAD